MICLLCMVDFARFVVLYKYAAQKSAAPLYSLYLKLDVKRCEENYTHRQKLSNTTFFRRYEVAERNMWVIEIKYFEFYCKFYYFLSTLS